MTKRLLLLISAVLLLTGCSGGKKSLVIGVSQCSNDIWRTKLNDELSLAARVEGVTLRFSSADDDSQKQMAQIRRFVADGVDLLIISPNQTHTITPAVEAMPQPSCLQHQDTIGATLTVTLATTRSATAV